ncbi:hypothetical protein HC928_00005 [bacterium]|nr:hypothetical protein [bacterium]
MATFSDFFEVDLLQDYADIVSVSPRAYGELLELAECLVAYWKDMVYVMELTS